MLCPFCNAELYSEGGYLLTEHYACHSCPETNASFIFNNNQLISWFQSCKINDNLYHITCKPFEKIIYIRYLEDFCNLNNYKLITLDYIPPNLTTLNSLNFIKRILNIKAFI